MIATRWYGVYRQWDKDADGWWLVIGDGGDEWIGHYPTDEEIRERLGGEEMISQ